MEIKDNSRKKIVEYIKSALSKYEEIECAYIYGSFLTERYNSAKSDIDILLIVKDSDKPESFIRKIKNEIKDLNHINPDVNVVFYSEFKRRWHVYRPPTYFLGVKLESILVFGKDLLSEVMDTEIKSEAIFRRAVDLAQSSRGIYLNSKNIDFWKTKYIKWLRVLVLEILYLEGTFDLSFKSGLKKLIKIDGSLEYLNALLYDEMSMGEISSISEKLRNHIYSRFIKREDI